jgi:diguanylate cyclase (GGDEF)-like protein/PAS domain S-box-containing protein
MPFDEIFKTIQIYELGDWTYRPVIMSNNELSMISDALWHMAEKMNSMYLDIKFNEYRYKLSLEFSNDIIYDIDLTKNSIDSNAEKWEKFFGNKIGLTEKQVFGGLVNAVHPEDKNHYETQRNQLLHDCYDGIEKKCEIEFRVLLNDGDYHWVLKKDILVKGATDNIEHIVGTIAVIDEKKNIELKARVDSLTGLYNRAEFINRINALFKSDNHTEGAVIFFDIDDFKHINDNYGHDVGDDVLKFVGKSIIETIDKGGIGGRYGGDELLAYVYSKDKATAIADAILLKLSKDFIVRGSQTTIRIQSSIGIAYYPEHETEAERLIKKADAAMYHAKKNGKNQYRIFTPGDDQTG